MAIADLAPLPDRAWEVWRGFAKAWGRMGAAWGVPPSKAEVHGYLLVHGGPLTDAVADVVVTSYDLAYHEPVMFSSRERPGFVSDVPMRVAARATSAGPTYFEPQELTSGDRQRVLVDGGVYVNNPSILGYLLGGQAARASDSGLVLVSLGTGTRPPREPSTPDELKSGEPSVLAGVLLEAVATGSGAMGNALLGALADGERFTYWRIQTDVGTCSFTMDDSRPENRRQVVECGPPAADHT